MIACLDHGFVRLVDHMGDDAAIVQAARVSYGEGTKTPSDDRSLIRYLMRHHHTTPFEMVELKFHCKLPIFVARQWVRHRTANVNELSGRYSVLPEEFYVPDIEHVTPQSSSNKQGRENEGFTTTEKSMIQDALRKGSEDAFGQYSYLNDIELARELARTGLPLSTYTEWYWKIDLHNLFHFLRLRTDSHAQYEIQVYADAMAQIVSEIVPVAYEAWVDYQRDAVAFSRMEMEALRGMLSGATEIDRPAGVSEREYNEFVDKLNLWP